MCSVEVVQPTLWILATVAGGTFNVQGNVRHSKARVRWRRWCHESFGQWRMRCTKTSGQSTHRESWCRPKPADLVAVDVEPLPLSESPEGERVGKRWVKALSSPSSGSSGYSIIFSSEIALRSFEFDRHPVPTTPCLSPLVERFPPISGGHGDTKTRGRLLPSRSMGQPVIYPDRCYFLLYR